MQFGAGFIGGIASGLIGSNFGMDIKEDAIEKGASSLVDSLSQNYSCENCGKKFSLNQQTQGQHLSTARQINTKENNKPKEIKKKIASSQDVKDFQSELSLLAEDYGGLEEIPREVIINLGASFGLNKKQAFQIKSNLNKQTQSEVQDSSFSANDNIPLTSQSSENEEIYRTEFMVCNEDGKITSKERRLLNSLASALNISKERVEIIETACLSSSLSEAEKQYAEEYKACVADGPILGSTRRLLDRLATSLELSNEQISKLEKMVLNKKNN